MIWMAWGCMNWSTQYVPSEVKVTMQSAKRTTTCELIQRRQAPLESGNTLSSITGNGTAADIFGHLETAASAARVTQGPQGGVLLELHQGSATVDQTDHTHAAYHLWAYMSDMSQCCMWQ